MLTAVFMSLYCKKTAALCLDKDIEDEAENYDRDIS